MGQILDGVWRFEARHPELSEDEDGVEEGGWSPIVGWWAVTVPDGLVLIDPLIDDWAVIDQLLEAHGGCAGIIRTCHWHHRSIEAAAARYQADVWAKPDAAERGWPGFDRELGGRQELFGRIMAYDMERDDELALWLADSRALVFGDAMLRGDDDGRLRACPESWTQPPGGPARLRALLGELTELPVEHVLVSHGPLVLGQGLASLRAATS